MTTQTTFYLSRIIGNKVFNEKDICIGKLCDVVIDYPTTRQEKDESVRPRVSGIKIKASGKVRYYTFSRFSIFKTNGNYKITCGDLVEITTQNAESLFFLAENILDKQIVDLNGRKLVRVNDIRLVAIPGGAFAIAVDVGMEGLLRRIGIAKQIKKLLTFFRIEIPAKFILWDDVEAVDFSNYNIKLSKVSSKLHTLHPSDLADIIEELGKDTRTAVFSSLDEEKAADVLEELDTKTQVHIIENLSIEKAADVLEKMPANEAADIIDELETEKAEILLNEMESEVSDEVRELMEYPDNTVGGLMTTDFMAFHKNSTVNEVLKELRAKKPDPEVLYNLFITGANDKLIASVSFREILISEPEIPLHVIMNKTPIFLYDTDKIDSLAESISRYNLLAIPVTDKYKTLIGAVIIDDVIEDLISKRKTNKR